MTYPPGPPPGYPGGPAAPGGGPYGAPGGGPYQPYGYGPPQVEHPQGTIVLVLGIGGLVFCQLLGPVAWVMGSRALAEIDAAPGRYSNRGLVQAGRICGIVSTVIFLFSILMVVLIFGLALLGSSSGSTTG